MYNRRERERERERERGNDIIDKELYSLLVNDIVNGGTVPLVNSWRSLRNM